MQNEIRNLFFRCWLDMGHLGQIQNRTHMVPICDQYGFAHVGPVWKRVAKPLSVTYGLTILDPYKIPHGTLIGLILSAGWVRGSITVIHQKITKIYKKKSFINISKAITKVFGGVF